MASSKELLRQIDDITECPICAESFKEPKVLPCIHTFCLHCLERYGKDKKCKNMGETMSCPLCRKEFTIPRSGLKQLPNNYFIIQLLQINQSSSSSKETKQHDQCDICLQMSEKAVAAAFCVECHEHLCKACSGRHKIQNSSKTHQVVELQNKPSAEELMKMAPQYCEQHPNREIEFFCYDCKTTACVVCYVNDKHNKHECCDVKKSADEFRVNLKQDMDRVAASALRTQEEIKQLEVELSRFNVSVDATRSEIAKNCDKIRSLIDKHQSQLMGKLSSLQQKHLKECETRKDELERLFVIKESFHRYCGELKEKGTSADVSRAAGDLHVRADELLKSQEELRNVPSCSTRITLTPSVADNINAALPDNIKDWIGEISFINAEEKFRNEAIEPVRSTLFLSNSSVVRVIPGKGAVFGIANIGNELFIARHKAKSVEVYDTNNITAIPRLLKISDERLDYPRLAACSHYNCLYVIHWRIGYADPVMYRVELSNSSVRRWAEGLLTNRLSITHNHTLLVTVSYQQRVHEYRLCDKVQEYTTHGKLIREISLDHSIDLPRHCIQLSDGNFVISHDGSTQHRVCIVDSSGQIIKSYGGSPGSGVGQLNQPWQLSVDKDDHVFVGDLNNNRVQLLSPKLSLLGPIQIPGYELHQPVTLHFDNINHRLYIGESFGRVLVVELSITEK